MFSPDLHLTFVNGPYAKALKKRIAMSDLTSKHPRTLVRLQEYFDQNPLNGDTFNHYGPAKYLIENMAQVEALSIGLHWSGSERPFLPSTACSPRDSRVILSAAAHH